MVQTCILVNASNRTFIRFEGSKRGEIIGNRLYCMMVASFLFDHNGDHIFFVASDWKFGNEPWNLTQDKVYADYVDVTEELLADMVEEGDIVLLDDNARSILERYTKL